MLSDMVELHVKSSYELLIDEEISPVKFFLDISENFFQKHIKNNNEISYIIIRFYIEKQLMYFLEKSNEVRKEFLNDTDNESYQKKTNRIILCALSLENVDWIPSSPIFFPFVQNLVISLFSYDRAQKWEEATEHFLEQCQNLNQGEDLETSVFPQDRRSIYVDRGKRFLGRDYIENFLNTWGTYY